MTANLDGLRVGDKVAQNRKEKGYFGGYTGLAIVDGKIREFMSVRLYWLGSSGDSPCYCCVWITGYGSGGGKASGYGYHKQSTAMQNALDDAGIVLYESIDGRGESNMNEAIEAIGVALGHSGIFVHHNYG